jgi:hypothetical protein
VTILKRLLKKQTENLESLKQKNLQLETSLQQLDSMAAIASASTEQPMTVLQLKPESEIKIEKGWEEPEVSEYSYNDDSSFGGECSRAPEELQQMFSQFDQVPKVSPFFILFTKMVRLL